MVDGKYRENPKEFPRGNISQDREWRWQWEVSRKMVMSLMWTRKASGSVHNILSCSFLQQNHRKFFFSPKYSLVIQEDVAISFVM